MVNNSKYFPKIFKSFLHELEEQEASGCPVKGCNGFGNTSKENFSGHHRSEKNCPKKWQENVYGYSKQIDQLRDENLQLKTEIVQKDIEIK